MSEFLLLAVRPPGADEVALTRAAHDVIALSSWHQLLRRWGLLRAFAVPDQPASGLRACLLVQASERRAAVRLAAVWERLGGYEVTVLPLHGSTVLPLHSSTDLPLRSTGSAAPLGAVTA